MAKYVPLGRMAYLCLPLTILEGAPNRIPKPCVVGSNPTGGADGLVSWATTRPSHNTEEVLSNRWELARERGGGCAGNTPVRSSDSAEVPDSVYGTPSPLPLSAALNALRMTETTTHAHDLPLGDPVPLPTSPRVESIPRQEDPDLALAVLWSADRWVEGD
jgi:hypothetical protein